MLMNVLQCIINQLAIISAAGFIWKMCLTLPLSFKDGGIIKPSYIL